jgi:hypothetical protein
MTMPRQPLLRLFLIVAVVELVVGTTTWHPPLRDTVVAARQFWDRDDVQRAPLDAWRGLFDQAGRMLGKPNGVLGALVNLLLGIVFVVVGVPLMIAGAIVIGVLWLLPYLAVKLALWIVSLLITLRVLPLAPVALWLYHRQRRLAGWGQTGCATQAPTAVPTLAPAAARPAPAAQGTLAVMGVEESALSERLDPYTRGKFAPGERFVKCGGRCGRAYKLKTWAQLGEQCPMDGAAFALGQAGPASAVTPTETQHSSPA